LRLIGANKYKIGGKAVTPRKITIAQWRDLFDSIHAVPQLIVSVMTAAPGDKAAYFVAAIRESFDDIVRVTAVLTGIDEEYIEQNASIDELVAFYGAVAKANNFGELLKNGRGVLSLAGLGAAPIPEAVNEA
jgi:5-formaminoimidazole-4-carboxamide-1-beta-D-ribofuranosyl 5'-monophosphate synthetase